ncbi:MAG: 1-deoxy-D-xylulose-5-phosphate reductoisomerase [bacterium]|nr:1-deoxy-D-xylulose-5-phosphate reductoisomerase [bacterium]
MKKISVLGSTGSIGVNTLKIAEQFPDRLKVVGLAAGRNLALLARQAKKFRPARIAVGDPALIPALRSKLKGKRVEILAGMEGLVSLARDPEADEIVLSVSGSIGLRPALAALRAGKQLALANKEALVMGGELLMKASRGLGDSLIPIDSEHSALFQLLEGKKPAEIRRLFLTASGGPFLHRSPRSLSRVTPEEALFHPVWKMGRKVSIDSATLMNKGLEVIEAHYLFRTEPERLKVLIHPQGRVHALLELKDGAVLGHLGIPDMRIPIAYALSYPERLPLRLPALSLPELKGLTFLEAEPRRFPALRLAYSALAAGGTMPAVLSIANENAVEAFLARRILFPRIVELVARVLDARKENPAAGIEAIAAAETWARRETEAIIHRWR